MLNNKFCYNILSHLLVFFYIYPVKFVFFSLSSRIVLSIFGFIYLIYKHSNIFNIPISQFYKYLFLLFISIWSFFVVIYNNSEDYEFLTYPLSILLILLASFFISNIIKTSKKDYFFLTTNLIINVVIIQVFIALLMFLIPNFGELINSLTYISDSESMKLEEALEFRLVGLGSKFFGSGIVNGFALMLITFSIRNYNLNNKYLIRYSIKYLIIFTLGMMMARTTIIGFLLSFFILFFKNNILIKKTFVKIYSFLVYLILLPLFISFFVFTYFPNSLKSIELAFEFGFELFINYFENNSLQTKSSNILKKMIVLPNEIKTYLIGDGFYIDPVNKTYYMRTDIGYLRLLYYFGIPGLLLYLFFQTYMLKLSFNFKNKFKIFYVACIFYLLILNLKGFTDLVFLTVLFSYDVNKSKNEI